MRLYRRANRDGNPRQLTSEAPATPYGLGTSEGDFPRLVELLSSEALLQQAGLSPTLVHSALGQLKDAVAGSDELRSLLVGLLGLLLADEDDDGRAG